MPMSLRPLGAGDEALLARATLENLNWAAPRFTAEQLHATPAFAHYFGGWPREGDLGTAVELAGAPVGAGWCRRFPAADPGYGFVDEAVPELSLWVAAPQRGQGLGTRLLTAVLAQARRDGAERVSLSVERGNPARRLYERAGFAPAGDGFDEGTMVVRL